MATIAASGALFTIPDETLLSSNMVKREMNMNNYCLSLSKTVRDLPYLKSPSGRAKASNGGGNVKEKSLTFQEHKVQKLKRDRNFSVEVIQQFGLLMKDVQNPKFDGGAESCKFIFNGRCTSKCHLKRAYAPRWGSIRQT